MDGKAHFLHLYAKVIEDIPLVVKRKQPKDGEPDSSPNISRVVVRFEPAAKPLEYMGRHDILYKVSWIIYDHNDKSGEIFVINSFELNPDPAQEDGTEDKTQVKRASS